MWDEAYYAYHPENPAADWFGNYGFPAVPGLLDGGGQPDGRRRRAARALVRRLRQPRHPAARHARDPRRRCARSRSGDRKYWDWQALGVGLRAGLVVGDVARWQRVIHARDDQHRRRTTGSRPVTPDPDAQAARAAGLHAGPLPDHAQPGPVGHGFTQANLDTGPDLLDRRHRPVRPRASASTRATRSPGPTARCPRRSSTGSRPGSRRREADDKLASDLQPPQHVHARERRGAGRPSRSGSCTPRSSSRCCSTTRTSIALDQRPHPHQHDHRRTARDGAGGFWEITTASCIDFPQQQQVDRDRRQPRRHPEPVHHGARPRGPGGVGTAT